MRTWETRAACGPDDDGPSLPPELFQVTQRGSPAPGVQEAVCGPCPVSLPCLADGWWDDFAVRGGMTPRQRRGLEDYLAERRAAELELAL